MKTRIITAAVMTAVLVPFFIFSDTVAFPVLVAFLSIVASYEMLRCAGLDFSALLLAFSFVVSAAAPFIARYADRKIELIFALYFCYFVLSSVIALFSGGKLAVSDTAASVGYISYASFGLTSLVFLRDLSGAGIYAVFLPFVISWMTDTFAYFCGMAIGRHKLIPSVSPKKTVEGSIGGTLFAVLLSALYCFAMNRIFGVEVSYIAIIVISFVCSLLSQCGDLIMSLIKRHYGIKDYGRLFPGHGGVLDRFDSIIITSPFIYLLYIYVPFCEVFR